MDWHELEKMKVTDLRELAQEKAGLEGVSGMHKEDLVEALAKALGIEKPHKVVEVADKGRIKAEIRELKKFRDAALAAHQGDEYRRARDRIGKLKRKLRRQAHVVG